MDAIRKEAGITAVGASPNAAIPAGRLSTPAPTILLIRLKVRSDIVAFPSDGESVSPAVVAVIWRPFVEQAFETNVLEFMCDFE